jgi:hypothetical protein
MSYRGVLDALVVKLESLTDFGLIDTTLGRQEGLPWDVQPSEKPLPLWVVTAASGGPGDESLGEIIKVRHFVIRGFFPLNLEAESGLKWTDWLDDLEAALTPNPALTVCAETRVPRLTEVGEVLYGSGEGGGVLCHFARFEFETTEFEAR